MSSLTKILTSGFSGMSPSDFKGFGVQPCALAELDSLTPGVGSYLPSFSHVHPLTGCSVLTCLLHSACVDSRTGSQLQECKTWAVQNSSSGDHSLWFYCHPEIDLLELLPGW